MKDLNSSSDITSSASLAASRIPTMKYATTAAVKTTAARCETTNAFKIQQYSNSKVKVGIGKNVDVFPVFYGELQPEGLHTNLYVKMRPNPFGYFICVFPLIALLLALISFILTINNILIDNSNIENMIIFAPLLTIIGYLVLYFYYFIKLHDMEYKLKDIFKKNLINSDL